MHERSIAIQVNDKLIRSFQLGNNQFSKNLPQPLRDHRVAEQMELSCRTVAVFIETKAIEHKSEKKN